MAIKKYSVGMIGCGDIWNKGHWPQAFAHLEDVIRIKYTYDIDAEKAQSAAEKSGAEVASDVDKLFEDPEIDIVTIATPPFARLEYVEKACRAGKHIMLEKPMARTLEDAVAIRQKVEESGVRCSIPFARTVTGPLLELQSLVGTGHFGAFKSRRSVWLDSSGSLDARHGKIRGTDFRLLN